MILIEFIEEREDVYDITVEDNHNFYANNVLVHNCLEICLNTKAYEDVRELYREDDDVTGEVAICNIAGIVVANVENEEQYAEVAEMVLWLVDFGVNTSEYRLPHIGYTAKKRLSAGIGIVGLAEDMARNGKSFYTQDGLDYIHKVNEKHYYHLAKASLKLSKILGTAEWMHKTAWPKGWLPIDTYNKNVDSIVSPELSYDWETLRSEIIENGGIRNSVLVAHMPAETSSLSSATTNGIYPVRSLMLLKKIGRLPLKYFVPFSDTLDYDNAWESDPKDIVKLYAITQKWTDQAISVDEWYDVSEAEEKVDVNDLIRIFLMFAFYGVKTKYYTNTKTTAGNNLEAALASQKEQALLRLEPQAEEDEEFCESCTL